MQELETHDICARSFKRELIELQWSIIIIVYFSVIYYLPSWMGDERNPACQMNTAIFNVMFAWILIGINVVISVLFCVAYLITKCSMAQEPALIFKAAIEKYSFYKTVAKAINFLLGYTIFFYWSQIALWPKNSWVCDEGWILFDKLNWYIILLYTMVPAIVVTVGLLCCICWFPCILKHLRR